MEKGDKIDAFIEGLRLISQQQMRVILSYESRWKALLDQKLALAVLASTLEDVRAGKKPVAGIELPKVAKKVLETVFPVFESVLNSEAESSNTLSALAKSEKESIQKERLVFEKEIEDLKSGLTSVTNLGKASRTAIETRAADFEKALPKFDNQLSILEKIQTLLVQLNNHTVKQKLEVQSLKIAVTAAGKGILEIRINNQEGRTEEKIQESTAAIYDELKWEKFNIILPLNELLDQKIADEAFVARSLTRRAKKGSLISSLLRHPLQAAGEYLLTRRHGATISEDDVHRELAHQTSPGAIMNYCGLLLQHPELLSPQAQAVIAQTLQMYSTTAKKQEKTAEQIRVIEERNVQLKKQSMLEPMFSGVDFKDLPPVLNREAILRILHKMSSLAARSLDERSVTKAVLPFSVMIMDIDHFKKINDTYGHGTGDRALKEFVKVCLSQKRESDEFGRYGGEEFIMILPQTQKMEADVVAKRIIKHVQEIRINVNDEVLQFTVSIGISEFPSDVGVEVQLDKLDESLRELADSRLYAAKEAGRNRVISSGTRIVKKKS